MPVAELVRFAETLDDSWHSPVADAAAQLWDVQRPVFVRSSASHVLVAGAGGDRPRLVLRMRPGSDAHVATLERGARAAAAWHGSGGPFVAAVPSTDGRLVERVEGYAVTALVVAEGEQLGASPLDAAAARAWGAALAGLHASLPSADGPADGLPTTESLVTVVGLPAELTALAETVRGRLAALPRGPEVRGVLHGDPEPDNVIRTEAGLVLVDPDDVRVGWFASDVAFGLRDWQDEDGRLEWAHEVPAAFLEGYRTVRTLTDAELETVPLLASAAALEDLAALQPHLQAPAQHSWPEWATALHTRIQARADELRRVAWAAAV